VFPALAREVAGGRVTTTVRLAHAVAIKATATHCT
jgi:hypothetical protein